MLQSIPTRLFEAQKLHAKRLGVRLSAVLPRVRPEGRMISAVALTPGEALCDASGQNFVVARGVRRPMEQPFPIGLPSQRPAPVLAAAIDLDRPASGDVGFMDERLSLISAELGGSIIREMGRIVPRLAGVQHLHGYRGQHRGSASAAQAHSAPQQ
jgi:hypothetical protein